MKYLVKVLLALLVGSFFISAAPKFGSAFFSGMLTGMVIDCQEAENDPHLQGVKVTIRNEDTNTVVGIVQTGANGEYTIGFLPPGKYSVTVEFLGYESQTSYFTMPEPSPPPEANLVILDFCLEPSVVEI